MAIVIVLFGMLLAGATFTPYIREGIVPLLPERFNLPPWFILGCGAALFVCGVALVVMFGKSENDPALGTPILAVGTLVALVGILCAALFYMSPFSWMIAILGLAVFIDALCLKINFAREQK